MDYITGGKLMDIIILYVIPFILFGIYLFLTYSRFYKNINKQSIKRTYYFLVAIWITLFIKYNNVNILSTFNIKNDSSIHYLNEIILICLLFFIAYIWDIFFISCKQINKIALKGIEITTEEFKEATKAIESNLDNYNTLQVLIKIQYTMFRNMKLYYQRMKDLSSGIIYKKIIEKYTRLRRDLTIDVYYDNPKSLEIIQKKHKIDKVHFSSICYSLSKYGVCIPNLYDDSEKDRMFAAITTSFTKDDLLLVIVGEKISNNENLIIQNIISYFDSIVEIEGYKLDM